MQGLVFGVWRLGFICFGSLEIENPFIATNVFVCVCRTDYIYPTSHCFIL